VVSFQAAGTCLLDFNDPGNGNYVAASQVQQSVTIQARTASSPFKIVSVIGEAGHWLVLRISGDLPGSDVKYSVTNRRGNDCVLNGNRLYSKNAAVCRVVATQSANPPAAAVSAIGFISFHSAAQVTKVEFRMVNLETGLLDVIGRNFFGSPTVSVSDAGVRVAVVEVKNTQLSLQVADLATTPSKVHKVVVFLADGQILSFHFVAG
jgi:hypothetical protein